MFAASQLRPLFWRLTDLAMLFLRFAASENVASCVFWCVLTSVYGIMHAAAACKQKMATHILNFTRNGLKEGSVALENEVGKVTM